MNHEFIIEDARPLSEFKDKTFSDFKKRDVINTLFKSIELSKTQKRVALDLAPPALIYNLRSRLQTCFSPRNPDKWKISSKFFVREMSL